MNVFPDEYHLHTLETVLTTCNKVQAGVDLKQILCSLMTRLSKHVSENPDQVPGELNIFNMFRQHLPVNRDLGGGDVYPLLDLQVGGFLLLEQTFRLGLCSLLDFEGVDIYFDNKGLN